MTDGTRQATILRGSFGVTSTDETTAATADIDAALAAIFLTHEGKADPYPGYGMIREAAALYQSGFGAKIAGRYEVVQAILRDNRFGMGQGKVDPSAYGLTQEEWDARFPETGGIHLIQIAPQSRGPC